MVLTNKIFVLLNRFSKAYNSSIVCKESHEIALQERISELLDNPRFIKSNCHTDEHILASIVTIFNEFKPLSSALESNKKETTMKILFDLEEVISNETNSPSTEQACQTINGLIQAWSRPVAKPLVNYVKLHFNKTEQLPKTAKLRDRMSIKNQDELRVSRPPNNSIITFPTSTKSYSHEQSIIARQKTLDIEQSIGNNVNVPLVGSFNNSEQERVL